MSGSVIMTSRLNPLAPVVRRKGGCAVRGSLRVYQEEREGCFAFSGLYREAIRKSTSTPDPLVKRHR